MGLQLLQDEITKPVKSDSRDGESRSMVDEELSRRLAEISNLDKDIFSNAHVAVDVLNDLLNYEKSSREL